MPAAEHEDTRAMGRGTYAEIIRKSEGEGASERGSERQDA